MAQIHEETVVITLSKLIKNDAGTELVATNEICDALQAVAEELAGSGVIVEIVRA